jgi:hypothetical protein
MNSNPPAKELVAILGCQTSGFCSKWAAIQQEIVIKA